MDRPSFMFGSFGTIATPSPLRQYENAFREAGVPLYVHEPSDGPVHGDLLKSVQADLADPIFVKRFQEGLSTSLHFRDLHIQPGNYGNGETHETIFRKVAAIDLNQCRPALEVFDDRTVPHLDYSTPERCLKILASDAAVCSVKMNFALGVSTSHGFVPMADAAPYANLLSAKYSRAVASSSAAGGPILSTDLSLAIFDELVPAENLSKLNLGELINYRKEAEPAREAFLENLLAFHAKFGQIPASADYAASIEKILTTEIRPAARVYRDQLDAIYEKLFGKIKGAAVAAAGSAVTWAGSSAAVHLLGDLTWQKLVLLAVGAASYVGPQAIDALAETRNASRENALSFLLDLET